MVCWAGHVGAAQILVPADYSTIQAAIDAAADGDVIIVSPGRYIENINFLGKGITLQSTNPEDKGIVAATIIDGNQAGSCVTIANARECALLGLTLTNGSTDDYGGGVCCYGTPARIANNLITGNSARIGGGGLAALWRGEVLVQGNTISGNSCTLGCGGGIYLHDLEHAHVRTNTITANTSYLGAGIYAYAQAQIIGNLIADNTGIDLGPGSPSMGAGIFDDAVVEVVAGNLLLGNSSPVGGGFCAIFALNLTMVDNLISGTAGIPSAPCTYAHDAEQVVVAGNSIIDNDAAGVWIEEGYPAALVNNTIAGNGGTAVLAGPSTAVIGNTVAYNRGGVRLRHGNLLANDLIVGNSTENDGAAVLLDQGSPFSQFRGLLAGRHEGADGGGEPR